MNILISILTGVALNQFDSAWVSWWLPKTGQLIHGKDNFEMQTTFHSNAFTPTNHAAGDLQSSNSMYKACLDLLLFIPLTYSK